MTDRRLTRLRTHFAGALLACIGLVAAAVGAEEELSPIEALTRQLAGMDAVAVTFDQQILGARGEVLERSSGELRMRRPNFRWQVFEPYPQTLVSDGRTMRLYDPDLAQVTVREIAPDEALPINLLNQDTPDLVRQFDVERLPSPEGDARASRYKLKPRDAQSLYEELLLEFADSRLRLLVIRDQLGQQTVVAFDRYSDPSVLRDTDFELEVPEGTDVIRG